MTVINQRFLNVINNYGLWRWCILWSASPLTWNMNFGFNTCLSHDETCLAGAAEDGGSRGSAGCCIHSQGIPCEGNLSPLPKVDDRWVLCFFGSGKPQMVPKFMFKYWKWCWADSQDIGWIHVIFKQQSRTSCCFWYHFQTYCRCNSGSWEFQKVCLFVTIQFYALLLPPRKISMYTSS